MRLVLRDKPYVLPFRLGTVKGDFHLLGEEVSALDGPIKVGGSFTLYGKVKSLAGGPEQVVGDYVVTDCGLESLKGIGRVGENLHAGGNNFKDFIGLGDVRGDIDVTGNAQAIGINGLPAKHVYGVRGLDAESFKHLDRAAT